MTQLFFVALEGFEPSQAEPESDVLPLHHKAGWFCFTVQRYGVFLNLQIFLIKIFIKVDFFMFCPYC